MLKQICFPQATLVFRPTAGEVLRCFEMLFIRHPLVRQQLLRHKLPAPESHSWVSPESCGALSAKAQHLNNIQTCPLKSQSVWFFMILPNTMFPYYSHKHVPCFLMLLPSWMWHVPYWARGPLTLADCPRSHRARACPMGRSADESWPKPAAPAAGLGSPVLGRSTAWQDSCMEGTFRGLKVTQMAIGIPWHTAIYRSKPRYTLKIPAAHWLSERSFCVLGIGAWICVNTTHHKDRSARDLQLRTRHVNLPSQWIRTCQNLDAGCAALGMFAPKKNFLLSSGFEPNSIVRGHWDVAGLLWAWHFELSILKHDNCNQWHICKHFWRQLGRIALKELLWKWT